MILFCIRKEGDLDNFVPIIYNLSSNLNNKIYITSINLSFSFKKDFRLKFLKNNSNNIYYIEPEDLFDFNILKKITIKIFFFKNIKNYNYLLNNFIDRLTKKIFNNVKIKSDFINLKLLIIDHVHPSKVLILKNLIKNQKRIKFKIISIPHGIPLLNKHNFHWDIAKKDIVEISKQVNLTILQHKFWYNELKIHNISKNNKILGSPRFSNEWSNLYSKIVPNYNIKYLKDKINIVYMSANSDLHIDYFTKKIETIKYLQDNKNINLIYKAHPRTNFSSLNIKKLKFAKHVNSRYLIKWADIIIGDISSIMVDALLLNKLYISPSYLRFPNNRLIFEDYKACLEIKTFVNFKNFFKSFNINDKNNIISQELKEYEKNKDKFISEIIYSNSENVINDYVKVIKDHII